MPDTAKRARELEPIRRAAFNIWKEHSEITGAELRKMLGDLANGCPRHSPATWVNRWRSGGGYARKVRQSTSSPPIPTLPELTWEQVLKACPNTETISILVVDGLFAKIKEWSDRALTAEASLKELSKHHENLKTMNQGLMVEFNQLMSKHNEMVAKVKSGGHFNLRTLKDILGIE